MEENVKAGFEPTMTIDEIRGKRVIANNGDEIGKVSDVSINPKTQKISRLKVNTGLFSPYEIIGEIYVDKITEDGVFLNIFPYEELVDKEVFNKSGKMVGTVEKVNRLGNTNELWNFDVNTGEGYDNLRLGPEKIQSIGDNVILNYDPTIETS